MDIVLKNLVGISCYVYLDDVVIFSKTAQEHAQRLENILHRFDKANLQLNPDKCVIAQPQVNYLGYVLSEKGVSASPDKVKAVRDYPPPKNVKDVRAFLGLASFYRRLVQDFATTAKPLTELTKKDRPFLWGPSQQKAFESMKDKLCTTPVLAYPNFELPFILTTDASKIAVAAILSQVQNGEERPIAYASRQMNKPEQAYSASEAELLALVWATKYFRCFLYGKQFLVRTDHAALSYLRTFADANCRLMRWSLRLSEFDFIVEHRPGTKIKHVDALSRHVATIMQDGLPSKEEILAEQRKDPFCNTQKPGTHSSKSEYFLDSLRLAHKLVKGANKKSHLKNKRLYDRKAKPRSFQTGDIVYLYNPAKKPGKCFKFHKYWTGPFEITAKLSDLNYEIISMNHKTQVVHVNRLKIAHNPEIWKPKQKSENPRIQTEKKINKSEEVEEYEVEIGSRPLLKTRPTQERLEPRTSPSQTPSIADSVQQAVDTPHSERTDPTYEPPGTPRTRRELQTIRSEPPLTRSRTRVQTQDHNVAETDAIRLVRHRTPHFYAKY